MADETLDVRGFTCPKPLVETQKKLRKMAPGQTLEIVGDHAPSKKEIPDTMKMQGHEVVLVTDEGAGWKIVIRKGA